VHSFLHSLLKFYSKLKFVWFCYLVVFISTLLLLLLLFYLVLLLKITLFNTVHCDEKKMLRVGKVGAHATFWKNLWGKAGPNRALIDSSEKRIMLDYQLTVLLVKIVAYVRLSLKITSQYETYTWGYTWRPLPWYPFFNIKLAVYHLLLYVVYLFEKP